MIKLNLTKKEFEVLTRHWNANLDYGWDGTFGGYDRDDKKMKAQCDREWKIARTIMDKIIDINRDILTI